MEREQQPQDQERETAPICYWEVVDALNKLQTFLFAMQLPKKTVPYCCIERTPKDFLFQLLINGQVVKQVSVPIREAPRRARERQPAPIKPNNHPKKLYTWRESETGEREPTISPARERGYYTIEVDVYERVDHTPPPTPQRTTDAESTTGKTDDSPAPLRGEARLRERLAEMGEKCATMERAHQQEVERLKRRIGDLVAAKEDARVAHEAELRAREKNATIEHNKKMEAHNKAVQQTTETMRHEIATLQETVAKYKREETTRRETLDHYHEQVDAMKYAITKLKQDDVAFRELCGDQEKELLQLRAQCTSQLSKLATLRAESGKMRTLIEAQESELVTLRDCDVTIVSLEHQVKLLLQRNSTLEQYVGENTQLKEDVSKMRELIEAQESELVTLREADEAADRRYDELLERNALLEQYAQASKDLMGSLSQQISALKMGSQ